MVNRDQEELDPASPVVLLADPAQPGVRRPVDWRWNSGGSSSEISDEIPVDKRIEPARIDTGPECLDLSDGAFRRAFQQ